MSKDENDEDKDNEDEDNDGIRHEQLLDAFEDIYSWV